MPNGRDYRPYRGSNYENEKFYGGKSVLFCVSASFFQEQANGIDLKLAVERYLSSDWRNKQDETVKIGSVAVPIDDLLNNIGKQIRERNKLAEHLSDFYKRQIISRSTKGIHTLMDEERGEAAEATVSLYIRLSYLGGSIITEITRIDGDWETLCARGDLDREGLYHLHRRTEKDLQSGHWDSGSPRIPRGRLICRCEELVEKEATKEESPAR